MILELGDYQVATDDRNFIIKQKKVVQAHRLAKEENVGKETWIDIAYCNTFESTLKFLSNRVFIDNEDITEVRKELMKLEELIKKLANSLNIKI